MHRNCPPLIPLLLGALHCAPSTDASLATLATDALSVSGRSPSKNATTSYPWTATATFNGAKFEKRADSCLENPNVQINQIAAYAKNIDYDADAGTLDYTVRGVFDAAGDFDFGFYYTTVRANSRYLQLWSNYLTLEMDNDGRGTATLGDNASAVELNVSCDDYNRCTINTEIDLAVSDHDGHTVDLINRIDTAQAFVALRGFNFSHQGTTRKFRDANTDVTLSDTTVDANGRLRLQIGADYNGPDAPKEFWARVYFVIGVYDPEYVAYSTLDAVDEIEWATSGSHRNTTNSKTVSLPGSSSELADRDCSDNGCKEDALPYFVALRGWGFDLSDNYEAQRVRGVARLENWQANADSATATVKYMGEMYRRDCLTTDEAIKKANAMRARVIVCRSTDVCSATYRSTDYGSVDTEVELDFTQLDEVRSVDLDAPYRVGLNALGLRNAFADIGEVLDDLENVGAQGARHPHGHDPSWFKILTCDDASSGCFDWSQPDDVFADTFTDGRDLYPIATLFQTGDDVQGDFFDVDCNTDRTQTYCDEPYTPDGKKLSKLSSDAAIAEDVRAYVGAVANRYSPYGLRHYEIGNEWEFWFEHPCWAVDYNFQYEVSDYVDLLELSYETLKGVHPDNQVVLGGLSSVDDRCGIGANPLTLPEAWLDKVLTRNGDASFDIVSIHIYPHEIARFGDLEDWQEIGLTIDGFADVMTRHGVSKPLWLTEVGMDKDADPTELARNIFRYQSVAFARGVQTINWHTHATGDYAGLLRSNGSKTEAWYSYRLFANTLGNFGECIAERAGNDDVWIYRFSGQHDPARATMPTRYVAWTSQTSKRVNLADVVGSGELKITASVREDGEFSTSYQSGATAITLERTPIIIEASN